MHPDRAVVVGAGLAGLAAAAALEPIVAEVLVVERDVLSVRVDRRRGVPQGNQLHNLLTRAQQHLDRLFPGFCSALASAGAGRARVADQTHVFELGTRMPERDLGMTLMCAPRPVIETVARELLATRSNIRILDGRVVVGLVAAGQRVVGVTVESRDSLEVIPADFVVDASGSGSQAPRWVESLGCEPPPVEEIRFGQWYATVAVERPAEWIGQPDFWLTFPVASGTRGGLISPVDETRWHVSVSGRRCDRPPRDFAELQAYARSLPDAAIGDLVAACRTDEPPHLFQKVVATWRRWDQLARPLVGVLPIGDAVASLNPLYGQGMSVAAWQATLLGDAVVEARDLAALTHQHLAAAARPAGAAWNLSQVEVPDPDGVVGRVRASADDHRRYVGVWHLVEPLAVLDELMSR